EGSVHEVRHTTYFGFDRWASRDWNFKTPNEPRHAEHADGPQERYEYPGGYETDEAGGALAPRRMEEIVAGQTILTGRSDCSRLVPGRWFTMIEVVPDPLQNHYLLTRLEFQVRRDDPQAALSRFEAAFTAIPAEHP